jgi:hypothetical protein
MDKNFFKKMFSGAQKNKSATEEVKKENNTETQPSLPQEQIPEREKSNFNDVPVFISARVGTTGGDSVFKDKEMKDFYDSLETREFNSKYKGIPSYKVRESDIYETKYLSTEIIAGKLGEKALAIYLPAYDRVGRDSVTAIVIGIPEGVNISPFEKRLANDIKKRAEESNLLQLIESNLRSNIKNEFAELATYAKKQFIKYSNESVK